MSGFDISQAAERIAASVNNLAESIVLAAKIKANATTKASYGGEEYDLSREKR